MLNKFSINTQFDCTFAEGKVIFQNNQIRDSYVRFMNEHINMMHEIKKMESNQYISNEAHNLRGVVF